MVKANISLSNRHVHLTEETVTLLFGEAGLTIQRYLNGKSGRYACNETVTIAGPKGSIDHVRVLGPCKGYDQVELLASDNYKLGVQAPLRMSKDLEGAAVVKIIGPRGSVELPVAIVAQRHIHMGPDIMEELGVHNGDAVDVKVDGPRGGMMSNVIIRKGKEGDCTMHIDQEEGNAFGIQKTAEGIILTEK